MLSGRLRGARLYATEGLGKFELDVEDVQDTDSVSYKWKMGDECLDSRMLDKARNG